MISSGPASIIYNEGGQRAEEDDLHDDEPVASAYVSRAPSPRPIFEPQLPIPERSHLEVPNATTHIRSSKSRGSPPELASVDKGKGREDAATGGAPSRSLSTRNIPGGIEIPGPIALTDSNSSRRSGSGRLGETLTSIWGNTVPSAGPSANSSILPSPLEGPTSRSALLNALKPLASVPEGSAIPEVIHADTTAPGGVPDVYRSSPPKTPRAESVAATSPKPAGTAKAASRVPTTTTSPRPGGTPRGHSAVATPRDQALGAASPTHVSPPTGAPPEQFTMPTELETVQTEPPTMSTPKPASRVPTKPPTRVPSLKPSPRALSPQPEPPVTELAPAEVPAAVAAEPPSSSVVPESVAAETAAAEEEDMFGWGQPRSKAGSRKGSKGASKATSKAASKVPSKAPTPKGAQTPKPQESNPEEAGAGASEEPATAERTKPRSGSGAHSPLATVPEDTPTEIPAVEGEGVSAPPGGFFVVNPDDVQDASAAAPPAEDDSLSFSNFGGGVGGGLLGAASSALGWGFGKNNKSKPTTPRTSTPAWGGAFGSVAGSVTESTGGTGWGAATGNNSGSNSGWMGGFGAGNRSANASSADLLGGAGTTEIPLGDLADSGDPYSQIPLEGTQATDMQDWDAAQDGDHTRGHLTIETDVTAAPDAEANTTVPPTAVGDSPEEGRDGDGGEGGEEGGAEKAEDEWSAWPVKTKKKKGGGAGNTSTGAGTPITPAASGGGGGKKKGKKK